MAYDEKEHPPPRAADSGAKRKSQATRRAVRLYLQDGLGWLEGYPEQEHRRQQQASLPGAGGALAWRAPAKGGGWRSLLVDRERLRRSFFALRGAQGKFPDSLRGVVGDIESWRSLPSTASR